MRGKNRCEEEAGRMKEKMERDGERAKEEKREERNEGRKPDVKRRQVE